MTHLIKLGVSGALGSFSEEAGLLYAEKIEITPKINYLLDMEGVLAAVECGSIDIGIFPVVNLCGGLVRMAYDAMGKHKFKVIDELWLEVQQCLLIKPDTDIKHIKKIVSHSQAIAQCKKYLQKNFKVAELIESQDTALAAKELAEGKLSAECAVLAPARSAVIYGLEIFAQNIQDTNPNLTAFIIVKQDNNEVGHANH